MNFKLTATAIALTLSLSATAAEVTSFTAGETATAATVNANFSAVNDEVIDATKAAAANALVIGSNASAASAASEAAGINATAIMALQRPVWQVVDADGAVFATILDKADDFYTLELTSGLVVDVAVGAHDVDVQAGMDTFAHTGVTNQILRLNSASGKYMTQYYQEADCSDEPYVQTSFADEYGNPYVANPVDGLIMLGGERYLYTQQGQATADYHSVSVNSDLIKGADSAVFIARINSSGTCSSTSAHTAYNYIKTTSEGDLSGVVESVESTATNQFGMSSTFDYISLTLPENYSIALK